MAIIGNYVRVRPEVLADLLANPESVFNFLVGNVPEEDPSFDTPTTDHPREDGLSAFHTLNIDKSWHVIHFLLNGEAWEGNPPLHHAVLGGRILSDDDVGYGPPRYLEPRQVFEVADALKAISAVQLLAAYDSVAMKKANIYGCAYDLDQEEHVSGNYEALVAFFEQASHEGDAIILYLE